MGKPTQHEHQSPTPQPNATQIQTTTKRRKPIDGEQRAHLLLDLPVAVCDELLQARDGPGVYDVLRVVRIVLGAHDVTDRSKGRLGHPPTASRPENTRTRTHTNKRRRKKDETKSGHVQERKNDAPYLFDDPCTRGWLYANAAYME